MRRKRQIIENKPSIKAKMAKWHGGERRHGENRVAGKNKSGRKHQRYQSVRSGSEINQRKVAANNNQHLMKEEAWHHGISISISAYKWRSGSVSIGVAYEKKRQ